MGILGYRFRGEICWSTETDACQSERIRPEFTAFTRCPNHEPVCLRPSVTGWSSKHISLCDQTKTPGDCGQKFFNYSEVTKNLIKLKKNGFCLEKPFSSGSKIFRENFMQNKSELFPFEAKQFKLALRATEVRP